MTEANDKTLRINRSDINSLRQAAAGATTAPKPMATSDGSPSLQPRQETADVTLRTQKPQMPAKETPAANETQEQGTDFWLKGLRYRLVRTISTGSGEGDVYLVREEGKEEEKVLKVYYPNFDINPQLQQAIHSMDFELVVRLYDYGKTLVEKKRRNYELMEYLQGGTLQEYDLKQDYNQFRRIALQAAGALAYCHQLGILHKDIKPANFFFRDKEHTQLVLGDFGISSVQPAGTTSHRTTQARTPIYAAPEMYSDVIDGVVDVTPAADFYSLGMTLFALWLGDNPLNANERVMMRQKNEGRLPRLNELPESVRRIVQGLTSVNAQTRWGYDQVERWFKGEDVKADTSSPYLRYKSFIVDPDRNLVADNVHELVPLLAENERLSTQYLYNGRIKGWLDDCGNQKLATIVQDIVTNKYADDQSAGLWASIYAMEPTYPYRDVKGNMCDDVHAVATSMMAYWEEYALLMSNPNDRVFLYLESHAHTDMARLRSYFKRNPGDQHERFVSVMKAVFETDPDMPFIMRTASGTIQQIAKAFGTQEMTEDEWESLCDGRLLAWMHSHADLMACEQLRILTEGKDYTRNLAFQVLYNMDREAAYDLDEVKTHTQMGEHIAARLVDKQRQSEEELAKDMEDIISLDGRLAYWMELQGWTDILPMHRQCFDLKSAENRERLGAYDYRTACYRFCRILGVTPQYQLAGGKTLTDGTALDTEQKEEKMALADELKKGGLAQWMAAFYHEDPTQDFSEPYSYEQELEQWVLALGKIDPRQQYYKRFVDARQETEKRVQHVRQTWKHTQRTNHIWKYCFYGLSALWIVLLMAVGVTGRDYLLGNAFYTIVLPLGGMSGIITIVRTYFSGYGAMLSFIAGVVGVLTSYIPVYSLRWVNAHHPSWFVAAIIAFTLIYMAVCYLSSFKGDSKTDRQMIDSVLEDDVKSTLLEPLHYTFKQRSFRFKGTKFGLLDDATNQIESYQGETVVHYMLWSVLVVLMLGELTLFSPKLLNVDNPQLGNTPPVSTILDEATQAVEDTPQGEQQ